MTHWSTTIVILLGLLIGSGCKKKTPQAVEAERPVETIDRRFGATSDAMLSNVPGMERDDVFAAHLTPILGKVSAQSDTWDSEVFAELASTKLKALARVLSSEQRLDETHETLLSPQFQSQPLRPDQLTRVVQDDDLHVSRIRRAPTAASIGYVDSLAQAARSLIRGAKSLDVHFKVVGVEQLREQATTRVLFESHQASSTARTQQNAVWEIAWDTPSDPRIRTIRLLEFEEIQSPQSGAFRDVTEAVLGQCESFQLQLTRGVDHWRKRLEANYGVDANGNQGLALGDVNGDGLEDVFVCQQGGLPNRLYLQRAGGVLEDGSRRAGVDWMEMCRSALFVDLDNDGDQDLVMAQGWYLMIMANDGSGRFQTVLQRQSEANLHSLSAADYDNDGDVDVFVCGRNPAREKGQSEGVLGTPIPYHDANNGGANMLLRNEGDWRFADVTKEVGLDQNNRRYTYAASWEDFDNDGDMDLYVANDFGRNNLYRNSVVNGQRRFQDAAAELGVEDISAGMSVTWGDYNNDGWMDAYISNMFSSAGNRIAYQRRFRESTESDQKRQFQRHSRGNTLFAGGFGPPSAGFRDVSEEAGVTMGRWAWGSRFCDFNNDGWLDLYVANGFITTEDSGDL